MALHSFIDSKLTMREQFVFDSKFYVRFKL